MTRPVGQCCARARAPTGPCSCTHPITPAYVLARRALSFVASHALQSRGPFQGLKLDRQPCRHGASFCCGGWGRRSLYETFHVGMTCSTAGRQQRPAHCRPAHWGPVVFDLTLQALASQQRANVPHVPYVTRGLPLFFDSAFHSSSLPQAMPGPTAGMRLGGGVWLQCSPATASVCDENACMLASILILSLYPRRRVCPSTTLHERPDA